MKLKKYLKENKYSGVDVAEELDVHYIYFNTIINGAKPGPKLAIKINEWSKGAVTLSDLRPDLWPPQ